MHLNNILVGAFIGILVLSIFIPVLIVIGFNQTTSLILLYAMPITGAVAGFAIEHRLIIGEKQPNFNAEKLVDKPTKNQEHFSNLIGKWVIIHTKMGSAHKGMVKGYDENLLALNYAVRIDISNSDVLDHLFIEKDDIKRIEVIPGNW